MSSNTTVLDLKRLPPLQTSALEGQIKEPEAAWIEVETLESSANIISRTTGVPLSLSFINLTFLLLSVFFFSQFLLAIFGVAWTNGFLALVSCVAFFGLFRVFSRVAKIIRRKNE